MIHEWHSYREQKNERNENGKEKLPVIGMQSDGREFLSILSVAACRLCRYDTLRHLLLNKNGSFL